MYIYCITLNKNVHFTYFFLVEKLKCILNSRNVNLSNFIPKTHILKLDASQIQGRLISEVIQYYHCYYL
jgi:hypothetical protein